MTVYMIRGALLWCSIFNIGLLLVWLFFLTVAHDRVYRMHGKYFRISVEKFDAIHYAGIAFFKIVIFFFNIVPLLSLYIVG